MTGLDELEVDGNRIHAGAGILTSKVAQEAYKNSLTGMEALAGIPGSIGGCLYMNAGAYGSEMKDVTVSAEIMFGDGHIEEVSVDDLGLRYRGSRISDEKIVLTFMLVSFDQNLFALADIKARSRRLSVQANAIEGVPDGV